VTTFDPSSREAEAQAEIAATRLGRGVAPALVAGFLALVAAQPLLELAAWVRGASELFAPLPAARDSGLLAAARAAIAEVESRYDERSALVRAVRPRAQALLTRGLGYGNERALVGRDGWLFFRDDVEHLTSRRPSSTFSGDPRAAIVAFRDQLAERGIDLVLLPTPLKPMVHPERLAAGAAAPLRRAGEEELLTALDGAGIAIVDLAERFARDALAPLYLAADTHWRPEAMEIAARELALALRARVELTPGDSARRTSTPSPRRADGDVAAMLELPAGSALVAAEEVVALSPDETTSPSAGDAAQVVLLGDSFAGIYGAPDLGWGAGAGLADRLAAQLGLPVDRIVRNAAGASATRRALADAWRRDPERFARLRAVVWQFAARELSQGAWERVDLP
jgi:alginate O-acetyltransferase complex protein AlgJ